jgi:enoyl-[acyl-carrier protein] reductase II
MFEGDLDAGELEIGQISGAIHEILPAAEILATIVTAYQQLKEEIAQGFGRF